MDSIIPEVRARTASYAVSSIIWEVQVVSRVLASTDSWRI